MTKMKSKKMTKSTFAIIIMAVVMIAMLAFGGTYAYFTATSGEQTGSVTTGTLTIGGSVTLTASDDSLVPNQTITVGDMKGVSVAGTTIAAYRIKFEITGVTGGTGIDESKFSIDILGTDDASLTTGGTATWTKHTDGYYYYTKVNAGDTVGTLDTIAPQLAITLDASANDDYQGLTVNYAVTIQAAQAEYNEKVDPNGALTDGAAIEAADAAQLTWENA